MTLWVVVANRLGGHHLSWFLSFAAPVLAKAAIGAGRGPRVTALRAV
jgi:hypothetical protein